MGLPSELHRQRTSRPHHSRKTTESLLRIHQRNTLGERDQIGSVLRLSPTCVQENLCTTFSEGDMGVVEPFTCKADIASVGIACDDTVETGGKDFCYVPWTSTDVVGLVANGCCAFGDTPR